MTSDWSAVGRRKEVGLGTLEDGVLCVDWVQWEKPVQKAACRRA